jgi:uncharacterized coiled-coil DUF342 family protein
MSTEEELPDRRELAHQHSGVVDPEDNEVLSELLERERVAASEAAQSISEALLNDERLDVEDLTTLSESADALNALWHHLCTRDEFQ